MLPLDATDRMLLAHGPGEPGPEPFEIGHHLVEARRPEPEGRFDLVERETPARRPEPRLPERLVDR